MRTLITTAALCLSVCGQAHAQDVVHAVDHTDLPNGTYVMVKEGGVITSVNPLVLTKIGEKDDDGPDEPDTPTGLAGKVNQWAGEVTGDSKRNETRKALSAIYANVGQRVADGEFSGLSGFTVIRLATNELLRSKGSSQGENLTAAWRPFRDKLSEEMDDMVQDEKLITRAQYVQVIKDISEGLEANTANAMIDLAAILAIIMAIIQMLKDLGFLLLM